MTIKETQHPIIEEVDRMSPRGNGTRTPPEMKGQKLESEKKVPAIFVEPLGEESVYSKKPIRIFDNV